MYSHVFEKKLNYDMLDAVRLTSTFESTNLSNFALSPWQNNLIPMEFLISYSCYAMRYINATCGKP